MHWRGNGYRAGVTDEQPDQPRPDLPPTLPLPTEPMRAFGARARAEMPDAAQVPVAAPPSEPPAPPTMPVVYLATPPGRPDQPIPSAPAVGSARSVPTPLAPTAPIPAAPAVGSAQVSPPPLAPTAPISSAPAVGSAQVSTPSASVAAGRRRATGSGRTRGTAGTRRRRVAPPPAACEPTQPAPPRLQLPHTPLRRPGPRPHPPVGPPPGPGRCSVQLGEVTVSSTTIHTPSGEIPLRGSQWAVSDQWHSQQRIPAWAVVCAVLGFFLLCFLSLLFLLAKETRYTGTVQVIITNGPRQYVVRIPVTDQRVVAHIHAQVNYARSLAAL